MALTTNTRVWQIIIIEFLIITGIFSLAFFFSSIVITFIIGVVLIIITERLHKHYKKTMKNFTKLQKKIYGYGALCFWIFAITFMTTASFTQIKEVFDDFDPQELNIQYEEQIAPYIPTFIKEKVLTQDKIENLASYIVSFFSNVLSQVSFIVFNGILIIPLMFVMFFTRREDIKQTIVESIPLKFKAGIRRGTRHITEQLHDYLTAKVIETVVIGTICCLGFYVAGLKGWLFLGILAGFLNIAPFIGPIIGAMPPLVVALLDEPIVLVYVFITIIVSQLIDNFYLIPFMISKKVQIDSLLGIVLILTGAQLFGIFGMIFAIPMYIIYKIVLQETYTELVTIYREERSKSK